MECKQFVKKYFWNPGKGFVKKYFWTFGVVYVIIRIIIILITHPPLQTIDGNFDSTGVRGVISHIKAEHGNVEITLSYGEKFDFMPEGVAGPGREFEDNVAVGDTFSKAPLADSVYLKRGRIYHGWRITRVYPGFDNDSESEPRVTQALKRK